LAGPTAYRLAYQRPGPLGTLAIVEQKLGDTETMAFVRGSSILQSGILDKRKQKNNAEENGEMISESGNRTVPKVGSRRSHKRYHSIKVIVDDDKRAGR